jgi:hypothetical protein
LSVFGGEIVDECAGGRSGGGSCRIDGVEIDFARVPVFEQTRKGAFLDLQSTGALGCGDDAEIRCGCRYGSFVRSDREAALLDDGDLAPVLVERTCGGGGTGYDVIRSEI